MRKLFGGRAAERAHELDKLEVLLKGILEIQKEQTEAVRSVAAAAKAQADVLSKWFDSFIVAGTPPQAVEPVPPAEGADSFLAARRKLFEETQDPELLEGVPPEIQLAWMLKMDSPAFLDEDDRA